MVSRQPRPPCQQNEGVNHQIYGAGYTPGLHQRCWNENFKIWDINITNNLHWSKHFLAAKKAHQHHYFLRVRKFSISEMTLANFYRCNVGNILSGWSQLFCPKTTRNCIVDAAESILQTSLPFSPLCPPPLPRTALHSTSRTVDIINYHSYPCHFLFHFCRMEDVKAIKHVPLNSITASSLVLSHCWTNLS